MRFDVLTLFPDYFDSPLAAALLGKARARGLIEFRATDLRDFAAGKHKQADDAPYGGGEGMVMKPEPLAAGIERLRGESPGATVVLLSPQGKRFDQDTAERYAHLPGLVLVCGRYEGVDARVAPLCDEELSIGDYVLAGGEAAALVVIEAVARLVPDVVGNEDSVVNETFPHRLKYPQYTRPREFRGALVPEVLLSGDHDRIDAWRRRESLKRTLELRPDLLEKYPPDEEEAAILRDLAGPVGRRD